MARGIPVSPGGLVDNARRGPVNAGASVLLLFGALVTVDFIRHGGSWERYDRSRVAGLAMTAGLFLLLAVVAPELATQILFGILVLTALGAADPLIAALNRVLARLQSGAAYTGGS